MAKQYHHKYTTEQDEWLKQNADKVISEKLTELFNETFNAKVTQSSILQKLQRLGASQGAKNRNYTEEERNYLREVYGTMPTKDIHKAFCEKFNCDINYYNLKGVMYRMGLALDDDEKDKFSIERITEMNKVPIGTERKYGGYTLVKVGDNVGKSKSHKAQQENWKMKQRVMWEKYHNQEVPPNCQICFLNGDKEDFTEENLVCIPLRYISTLTRNGWITGNGEITKAGLKYCELHFAIQDKRKEKPL